MIPIDVVGIMIIKSGWRCNMPIPHSSYDPDEDFRIVFDELKNVYLIQKRRLLFGFKFLTEPNSNGRLRLEFRDLDKAKDEIKRLREDNRKYRFKKRYVVLKH
jgi:hypothetical protein